MSSGCQFSLGCVDAREPVRASYKLLYKWPESDVEFVRSMTAAGRGEADEDLLEERREKKRSSPGVVDSFSCRQLYLRSYTFTKKETVPEKTRRCLGKVKSKAAVLPIFSSRSSGISGSTGGSVNGSGINSTPKKSDGTRPRKRKLMREMACSALDFVVYGLVLCSASVEAVD